MRSLKNEKGITLISLIITIVVLLVLAGVSIKTAIGNNGDGILDKAENAVTKTQFNSINEEVQLEVTTCMMEAISERRRIFRLFHSYN